MDGQKKIIKELQKLGKRNPELLLARLLKVDLTDLELAIMKHRYINGLRFKQIPDCDDVNVCENWVYKVHKSALLKTVDGLKLAEYLALFVN